MILVSNCRHFVSFRTYFSISVSGFAQVDSDAEEEPAPAGDTRTSALPVAASVVQSMPVSVTDIDAAMKHDANYFTCYAPEIYSSLKRLEVSLNCSAVTAVRNGVSTTTSMQTVFNTILTCAGAIRNQRGILRGCAARHPSKDASGFGGLVGGGD
jgi:hypothetical protein